MQPHEVGPPRLVALREHTEHLSRCVADPDPDVAAFDAVENDAVLFLGLEFEQCFVTLQPGSVRSQAASALLLPEADTYLHKQAVLLLAGKRIVGGSGLLHKQLLLLQSEFSLTFEP